MRRRLGVLLVLAPILFCSCALFARSSKTSHSDHQSSHAPDISGVWMGNPNTITFSVADPPMKPWAKAKFQSAKPGYGPRATPNSEDPILSCTPPGVPRIMIMPFPIQIIQLPGQVIMIFEYDHYIREINLNRQHPKDFAPTWMGDSIGKWDGDTLVVDTVGLNDKTWLDQVGHPHSSSLHVIERIRRLDHDTVEDQITIDDPGAYTSTWTGRQTYKFRPGWQIKEYVCEDNMPDQPR